MGERNLPTLRSHPFPRHLIRTTVYLITVSGLSFLVLATIFSILGLSGTSGFPLIFLIMGIGAIVGGTLWARSLIHSYVPNKSWRPALLTGITFGIMVFLTGYTLELIEQDLFYRNMLNAPGAHTQFLLLFSSAIFLVVGITVLVLTIQIMNFWQAILYSLITAIISAFVFLAVDLIMYAFGWRVGHIDFPARSTMATVTGLGLLASALVGGTTTGLLTERAFSRQEPPAVSLIDGAE